MSERLRRTPFGERLLRGCVHGLLGNGDAFSNVGDRILGVLFVLERQSSIGREVRLQQCIEHFAALKMSLAQDNTLRLLLHLCEVLQVDSIEPALQRPNNFRRSLSRSNVVAEIRASPNTGIPLLNGSQDIHRLVVPMRWSVIVDGDPNIKLLDQLIQASKGLWGWICGERSDPRLLCKLKHLAIRSRIATKAIHSVRRNGKSQRFHLPDQRIDLLLRGVEREHAAVELNLRKPEILGVLKRNVDGEVAKRVELEPQLKGNLCGAGFSRMGSLVLT